MLWFTFPMRIFAFVCDHLDVNVKTGDAWGSHRLMLILISIRIWNNLWIFEKIFPGISLIFPLKFVAQNSKTTKISVQQFKFYLTNPNHNNLIMNLSYLSNHFPTRETSIRCKCPSKYLQHLKHSICSARPRIKADMRRSISLD